MSGTGDVRNGSYRCPVCGYTDNAELPAGAEAGVIRCSHCDTALEVTARSEDSMRFSVQVAEGTAPS